MHLKAYPTSTGSGFCTKCGAPIPAGAAFCPRCGASVPPEATPGQAPLSGVDSLLRDPRAQSYWFRRLIGLVIDVIIVVVALAIIALVLFVPLTIEGIQAQFVIFGAFTFYSGALLVVYFTLAEAYWGGTVGRRAVSLRTVGPQGRAPTLAEAAIRNVSKIYWLLLLLDVVIGLATSKTYTRKYSDTFARTDVVDRSASSLPRV